MNPKGGRYYQAAMDINQLHAGADYPELRPTYVIFICTFDYYGMEEPVYFFEKYDVKNSLPYGDETFTIILNTTCPKEKVPAELRDFFDYVSDQEIAKGDPFIEHIHYRVEERKRQKGDRTDYDTGRGTGCTLQDRKERGPRRERKGCRKKNESQRL